MNHLRQSEQRSCRRQHDFVVDESAAATELGYIFTFLLGLMFLTMFSIWTWDLETATRARWTQEAMQQNLFEVASAVERADAAARLDLNATYAEAVPMLLTHSAGLRLQMLLTDDQLLLVDGSHRHDMAQALSSAASTTHSGEVALGGIEIIWVVLQNQQVTIQVAQPGL